MLKKIISISFCALFLLMIALLLLLTDLRGAVISVDENRTLTQMAQLLREDGTWNPRFFSDLEAWFNDHVGLRSKIVLTNAKLQYYAFHKLTNTANMLLGPNGELNYATPEIIKDYQHLNLWTEEQLAEIAESYQIVNDYLEKQGIQYYYFQCWDKHSIYPEYFPVGIVQNGTVSRTDLRIAKMLSDTTVNVTSPKAALIEAKSEYETYSVWGDPTHWTKRGAFIAYGLLMQAINAENENRYRVLQESDYTIAITDQGSILFGGIHKQNLSENFVITAPNAVLTNEKLTLYSEDQRHRFYTNEAVDNDTRVLILGDSYVNNYLLVDLAESFHETLSVWGDYTADLIQIVEAYKPDIVINECAERVDRSYSIIAAAKAIMESMPSKASPA